MSCSWLGTIHPQILYFFPFVFFKVISVYVICSLSIHESSEYNHCSFIHVGCVFISQGRHLSSGIDHLPFQTFQIERVKFRIFVKWIASSKNVYFILIHYWCMVSNSPYKMDMEVFLPGFSLPPVSIFSHWNFCNSYSLFSSWLSLPKSNIHRVFNEPSLMS